MLIYRLMRPMFTIHAGEYLVGEYIESHLKKWKWNVWIPSKDTGIDLLVTDQKNQRTVSLQVKFSKDFLPGKSAAMQNSSLRCWSWFTLNRADLVSPKAEFWVFVLMGFTSKPDFLVVPTAKLLTHMNEIHGHQKKLQVYLTSTKKNKCWETRGLGFKSDAMLQIADGKYKDTTRDLSNYLNGAGWDALKAKLDH